ncbi:thiamine pyrophosphate protein [Pigmentiphaga litoralis]|uniref:thiamine pyrophosphate-binding protein n=1 Tax=Pigmentiphaga litoralis TaxID=516702 RepID=UPI00167A5CDB|nr:thiamine pyrophosphate-binding protein [Pigmentiphaga litoralis]GGX23588.1 thiamine pyrophosphate protein [Pigmentiphaga litoralis]
MRTGGRILVDALVGHGVDTAYCVPGESYLAVLDALYQVRDTLRLIVCRQEGGAAHMAEAHAKLTGEPGICFVTRGPGSTNASIAIHTARQDSTPLIVFVGQVGRDATSREAWQEIDYRHMFGHIAKWVDQVDDARRLPEFISRAFHVATSGRPGPVVLALPEDMLTDLVDVTDAPRYRRSSAAPAPDAMDALLRELETAERPLLVLGGGGWTREASDDITAFAHRFDLPVACAFRRQDLIDNHDDHYIGEAGLGMDPRIAQRIRDADLVIAVGARLGETSTQGYALLEVPRPHQRLVHVHPDPSELGHVYHADVPVNAAMPAFARAARALAPRQPVPWSAWTRAARADQLQYIEPPASMPGEVDLGLVMVHLRDTLPADTIVSNGAGNYTLWVQRFWRYRGLRTQLAPTSGTMGYGLPAAIAAKLVHPERTALCFAGDGCFLMSGQELATAVQYQLDVLIIVVNNGMYGSIRMHQERHYPGNVWGTALTNPDFAALARSYGAHGATVTRTAEFPEALQRARAAGGPALIELQVSGEALSPKLTVAALRAQG